MSAIFYGIGVGPGDPELLTLKAVRIIREADVIALPGKAGSDTVAFNIVKAAVPEISEKELLSLDMPMTRDKIVLAAAHKTAALQVEAFLKAGKSVAFLTIGDPTVYSTYGYLQQIVSSDGFETAYVNGITSFTAAAASANMPLVLEDESLSIIPGNQVNNLISNQESHQTTVIMKSGKLLPSVIEELDHTDSDIVMVSNCTMENEVVIKGLENIPSDAPYLSLLIIK